LQLAPTDLYQTRMKFKISIGVIILFIGAVALVFLSNDTKIVGAPIVEEPLGAIPPNKIDFNGDEIK